MNQPFYYLVNAEGKRWCKHQAAWLDAYSMHKPTKVVAKHRRSLAEHAFYCWRPHFAQGYVCHGLYAQNVNGKNVFLPCFKFTPFEEFPWAGFRRERRIVYIKSGNNGEVTHSAWIDSQLYFYPDLLSAYGVHFEEVTQE